VNVAPRRRRIVQYLAVWKLQRDAAPGSVYDVSQSMYFMSGRS